MSASENLKNAINLNINRAIELVLQPLNYQDAESCVYEVLKNEKSTPELIDAALQGCFNLHEKMSRYQHNGWVHSMSHFMEKLWDLRLIEWIKKFHEVSFKGAKEWGATSCSDRLVGYFAENARFDDKPEDFGLTFENLDWMNWEYCEYAKARIEYGTFNSEAELEIFKLKNVLRDYPEQYNNEYQCYMIDVAGITKTINHLRELGGDASEFNGLIKRLLEEYLVQLESKIQETEQDDSRNWREGAKERCIGIYRNALVKTQADLDAILIA